MKAVIRCRGGCVVICLLMILVLTACSNPAKRKPNIQTFPPYPGAQQLPAPNANYRGLTPTQALVQLTNDQPEAVLEYYKGLFLQDGWDLDNNVKRSSNELVFDWINGAGQPTYTLAIIAEVVENGKTKIILEIAVGGGM